MPASDPLTLRSIGRDLRGALEREAARRGLSLNETVLALLGERLGLIASSARPEHDDLDQLAGTWSKSEAARFEEALRAQRPVHADLWR